MKKTVSLSTGNWLICDCLKRKAGRRGLTIEQIGYEASMTTDTVKGRIRNLLGKKYVERIEGSRPTTYRCLLKELPPPTESPQERLLKRAAEQHRERNAAIAHAAFAMDRMIRSCAVVAQRELRNAIGANEANGIQTKAAFAVQQPDANGDAEASEGDREANQAADRRRGFEVFGGVPRRTVLSACAGCVPS
ncbi:putative bacteriophage protein gp73 [Burkholderia pseudomallei]|nr:putative bacteriophage protein gp73 [Burkholderia pseudomallei]